MDRLIYSILFGVVVSTAAQARDDCQPVPASCTQMHARCETRCQTMPNVDRCMAATCTTLVSECRSSGVWNPRGAATCYKTKNRT